LRQGHDVAGLVLGDHQFGQQHPPPLARRGAHTKRAVDLGFADGDAAGKFGAGCAAPDQPGLDEIAEGLGGDAGLGELCHEDFGGQLRAGGEFLHPGADLLGCHGYAQLRRRDRLGALQHQGVEGQVAHIARLLQRSQESRALVDLVIGNRGAVDDDDRGHACDRIGGHRNHRIGGAGGESL